MFRVNCIKCRKPYEDAEPDPYLCSDCIKERNTIASQINNARSTVGQEPNNGYLNFVGGAKTLNTPDGRKAHFAKA